MKTDVRSCSFKVKMQIEQMYSTPLQEVVALNFYKINVISPKRSSHKTSSDVKCKRFFSGLKEVVVEKSKFAREPTLRAEFASCSGII